MSNIRKAIGFATLGLLSVALLVSAVGAAYYGDHDRHSYLGNANLDHSLVRPTAENPLTQVNSSGIFINYIDPSTLNVWNYLQQFRPAPAFSPLNEQDADYDDTQNA